MHLEWVANKMGEGFLWLGQTLPYSLPMHEKTFQEQGHNSVLFLALLPTINLFKGRKKMLPPLEEDR